MLLSFLFVFCLRVVGTAPVSDSLLSPQQARPGADLQPKLIHLDTKDRDYVQILGGPPESATMESGLVILKPKSSVGIHSTKSYEELVLILEGQGRMLIKGGSNFQLKKGTAIYCPPRTEHDIQNTGSGVLKYIYVAAKAD